jgi:hypothetical protein
MTMTAMTKGEREDLQRLVRQREKVQKSAAKQRSKELIADFENTMASEFNRETLDAYKTMESVNIVIDETNTMVKQSCAICGMWGRPSGSIDACLDHNPEKNSKWVCDQCAKEDAPEVYTEIRRRRLWHDLRLCLDNFDSLSVLEGLFIHYPPDEFEGDERDLAWQLVWRLFRELPEAVEKAAADRVIHGIYGKADDPEVLPF